MKRFKGIAVLSSLLLLGAVSVAEAEMVTIYGPVYITKGEHHNKETKLNFTAPMPGAGVIVVKNGGDSGKESRVSSAEIELNGQDVAKEKDFNKNAEVLEYNVTLQAENELEVKVESCKKCEIEISVKGEPAPPPIRPLTR
ncbi:MAG: hypothetical protein HY893_06635 [Deltaproteobacteria bacterium]|nr:hypothetical protein [Deltaproteobacteria bacterium]